MKKAFAFALALSLALWGRGRAQEKFDSSEFDQLLSRHVRQGFVDYAAWNDKDKAQLVLYLNRVSHADPSKLRPIAERQAFFLNAYNAEVIGQVLNNLPLKSIKDAKGFADRDKHLVGGEYYTLDELAKKIRTEAADPRVIFALNGGALGYPPLRNRAFRGDSLGAELDAVTTACIQDPGYVRLDDKEKVLYVSKIFDWYSKDFEDATGSVRNFIKINLPKDSFQKLEAEPYELKYLPFDWRLNAAPKP